MSWSDPIVEEVRKARSAYSAKFHHDLRAIYEDIRTKQKVNGRRVVSFAIPPTEDDESNTHGPLRESVLSYEAPTEPVASEDWEALEDDAGHGERHAAEDPTPVTKAEITT